jgi:hypothetical protein
MGCMGTKNKSQIVKGKKFSQKQNFTQINKVSSDPVLKSLLNRNMFYAIQKKTWLIVLDFLHHKDLLKVGKLNKYHSINFLI